jgi:hypothetical protein
MTGRARVGQIKFNWLVNAELDGFLEDNKDLELRLKGTVND